MPDATMSYDEAQAFARKFADHAYAELGFDGWDVIIPTNQEETQVLPDEFQLTPAWDAHNIIVSSGETRLQEWAGNSADYSFCKPLLILARAYNLEMAWHARYKELYQQAAEEMCLPVTNEEIALLNSITFLDYKSKRDHICYITMQTVDTEFYERDKELRNSMNER